MTARTYPYTAWVLLPSFKPKQVKLVGRYVSYGPDYGDVTEDRQRYDIADIHPTPADAIAAGYARLAKQQKAIDKQVETMKKKKAALDKAEKEMQ